MEQFIYRLSILFRNVILISIGFILLVSFVNFIDIRFTKLDKQNTGQRLDVLNWLTAKPRIEHIENIFVPTRNDLVNSKEFIIVHCDDSNSSRMDAPILDIYSMHINKFGTISYHIYIDSKSNVYQLHSFDDISFHVEGMNSRSISVCIQGNFDSKPMNKFQYDELVKTLYYISMTNNIPFQNIKGHREYTTKKSCPGAMVNLDQLRQDVKNYNFITNLLKE